MTEKWASRISQESSEEFIVQLAASEHCANLVDKNGITIGQYIAPQASQSLMQAIADGCNDFIRDDKRKRFGGIHVNAQDVTEFMQRFALGVALTHESAPWERNITFDIIPDHPNGLARYIDGKIDLTRKAICRYCHLKQKMKPMSDEAYGDIEADELPMIIGAEEARHASQRYNNDVMMKVAKLIAEDYETYVRESVARFENVADPEAMIAQELERVRPKTPEDFQREVDAYSNANMFINYSENIIENEAKEFVQTLRPEFRRLSALLPAIGRPRA